MNDFIAFSAGFVILFAAIPADKSPLAIRVCRRDNFVSWKIFIALITKHEVVFDARRASERPVARFDNLVAGVIFLAVFAKTVVIVEAMFANLNPFSMAVDDIPSFGKIFVTFLTIFVFVRVAGIAIQSA